LADVREAVPVTPYVNDPDFTLLCCDALEGLRTLPDQSIDACVTSPPYLDARPEYPSPTLHEFEDIFRELGRVVSGPALINAGRIFRDGCEVRWQEKLLLAAERAGWAHLDTRIWVKPNANPIRGQVFADSHEYVYVLGRPGALLNVDAARTPYAMSSVARLNRGWTNHIGVKNVHSERTRSEAELNELGARPRSFVVFSTGTDKGNPHPAPMPLEFAESMVALTSWPGETVIDPFAGSGTTCLAARRLGRRSIGIELNQQYAELAARRLQQLSLLADAEFGLYGELRP
jgi:DNA modification methylase